MAKILHSKDFATVVTAGCSNIVLIKQLASETIVYNTDYV